MIDRSRMSQMAKLPTFFVFNVGLPLLDMATDLQAFIIYFFYDDHPNWAFLTLFWIFNPFLMHLVKFCAVFVKKGEADWFNLFLHFPLVLPLRNFYLTVKLYKIGYGTDRWNTKDYVKVEDIQHTILEVKQILREIQGLTHGGVKIDQN